ncbi:MAG: hypothetical protein EOO75_14705 [Myxococcales bacterium]|nr:MAG: hypothetical protein EOO75_14705 [Myxococcales bacterium]
MATPVPPPGPFWDFLRHLLMKGAQPDDVLFIDRLGQPVTAGVLRRAIDRNRPWDVNSHRLAREFLDFASQTLYAPLPRPLSSSGHPSPAVG